MRRTRWQDCHLDHYAYGGAGCRERHGPVVAQQLILDSGYWDAFYREKNDWGRPWPRVLAIVKKLQHTFATPTLHVLDLACGNGRYAIPLAQMGASVDCVDFSEIAIAQLRAQAKEKDVGSLIETHCIDVREFAIKPNRYHLVLASGLFEYLKEAEIRTLIRHVQIGTLVQGVNVFVYLLQHPQATRVVGEYPLTSGFIEDIYKASAAWQIIVSRASLKKDFHPLEEGGDPREHKHYVARIVARRAR